MWKAESSWSSQFSCFDRLDAKAKAALHDLSERAALSLLQECEALGDKVRNPSAFVHAGALRMMKRREAEERDWAGHGKEMDHNWSTAGSSDWSDASWSAAWDKDRQSDNTHGLRGRKVPAEDSPWSKRLREDAGTDARGDTAEDSSSNGTSGDQRMRQLQTLDEHIYHNYDSTANKDSPWSKRSREDANWSSHRETGEDTPWSKRARSDSGSDGSRQQGAEQESHEEMLEEVRSQVAVLIGRAPRLDDRAKEALRATDPGNALDILHKTLGKDNLNNPSAYVMKICNDALGRGRARPTEAADVNSIPIGCRAAQVQEYGDQPSPSFRAAYTNLDLEAFNGGDMPSEQACEDKMPVAQDNFDDIIDEEESEGDWMQMDLRAWLRSVDNGKGFLMQYEEHLLKNFDTLEQIMWLYVEQSGPGNQLRIDEQFFKDLGVEKVAHKRLMEKWFRDRRQASA
mmetsp:Transcript_156927/g.273156  ORF Transcript_156927/g.273156 Transcript_156927/m.273156 type:complete len:457 (+) Transcript_156927:71-1441(+)